MTDSVIVDAGPLVALFRPAERHHAWVAETVRNVRPPMVTCEAVLAEATYLTRAAPRVHEALLDWIVDGRLTIGFHLGDDVAAVRRLMKKYRDRPMSLADACLVRMAETFQDHAVWTLDSDFRVYRKDGGASIPLVIPRAA